MANLLVRKMHNLDGARWTQFRTGFLALLPLWSGALPAGIAYGVVANAAGLTSGEAQAMSLIVFSAAAQVSAVALIEAQANPVLIVSTVVALNIQLLLLGATISRTLRLTWPGKLVTAWFLTDAAFAVAAARERLRQPVLLGAGVSMYTGWNLGTAVGLIAGDAIQDPISWGIDFIVSLAFLAVLVPLIQSRSRLFAALAAGASALLVAQALPIGVAVLVGGLAGAATGARVSKAQLSNGAGAR